MRGILKKAKTPYTVTGHLEATTDPAIIRSWWMQYPKALVGVAAGASGLVCLDVDMGEDAKGGVHDGWNTLIEHGLDDLPATITYKTPRGGDHYVYEPTDARRLDGKSPHVLPSGTPLPDVDRRAGSSYFLYYGDYVPVARDEFAPAPDWLMTEAPEPTLNPFAGDLTSWMEQCTPGNPSPLIREWVRAIPSDDFNHADMISLQATLVDLGARGEPGVPYALEALRGEWLREPYNTAAYARDWDLALKGAIGKYGAFSEPTQTPANLPAQTGAAEPPALTIGDSGPVDIDAVDYVSAAVRMEAVPDFFDTWTKLPTVVTPESLVERVRHVLRLCKQGGASIEEAVAIAWHSAARKADGSPIDLPDEVEDLAREISDDGLVPEEPFALPVTEAAPAERQTVRLLKPAEDMILESRAPWWGDEFMDRMAEINPVMSEQFYRLNRWMLLSCIFAPKAIIPHENGTNVPLNFYGILLGPSGVGKSESLNPVMDMNAAYYLPEDDPDIGGDSSTAGLTQALIRRDGRASLFHADEADAVLRSWSESTGAFSGMKNRIMEIYGGKVPMLNRTTAKDISGIRATAYLNVHLIGVDDRITDAIEPHDWESGFVNRFVWANGHRKHRTDEQKMFRVRRSTKLGGKAVTDWYSQWAAEFRRIESTTLASPDGRPVWMDFDDDVLRRDVETQNKLEAVAQNSTYPERLRPTFTRMEMTIRKCAALVAITRRRRRVEMEDYLIALEQAEEWLENVMEMVERTDESPRARQVNRLAKLIRDSGGVMKRADIHARKGYAGQARDTNALIDELIAQGRAEMHLAAKGVDFVRLVGKEGG